MAVIEFSLKVSVQVQLNKKEVNLVFKCSAADPPAVVSSAQKENSIWTEGSVRGIKVVWSRESTIALNLSKGRPRDRPVRPERANDRLVAALPRFLRGLPNILQTCSYSRPESHCNLSAWWLL